jgi:SAM-dependent methyltransferase
MARPAHSPRLARADALRLPFPDGAFDAVTGHSFLYLVPERAAVLAEAWRVLTPGGRLALLEPWAGPLAPRAVLDHSRDPRFLLSVTLWRVFSRWRGRFGAEELAALLTEQGFVAARCQVVLGGLGLVAYADKPPIPPGG